MRVACWLVTGQSFDFEPLLDLIYHLIVRIPCQMSNLVIVTVMFQIHLPTMYDLWHAQSRHPHQPGPHHLNLKHKGNQPYLQRLWIIFCNNFSGEFASVQ